MHGSAFAFARLAGVSVAAYSIFLRLASGGIHPALGAAVITGVALLVNVAIAASRRATGSPLSVSAPSVALLVVGVAAAGADLFTLSAGIFLLQREGL